MVLTRQSFGLLAASVLSFTTDVATAQASSVTASIAPAATTVSTSSTDAGVALFNHEAVQLTQNVLNKLNSTAAASYSHLFQFDNSTVTNETLSRRSGACKTYPGDLLWPSTLLWEVFDLLLGGALSPIVPLASPCYPNSTYEDYDEAKCATINTEWTSSTANLHADDPGSVYYPIYEGKTCLPGTNASALSNCTQGGYAAYSVNVSNVAQIQLAVNFARALNLRVLTKNTGHDYNGRSTGKDALSIWTHNLKDIEYVENYKSSSYSGPVFKLGAGVQGFELYQAADKYGVSAISGICPTVGVTGGYSLGGGHSPLMQHYGLGSDQVVAMEVVTPSGLFVTATPEVNEDLYWAMLGGGGGNYGIVTSSVVKVHPKIQVTSSIFNFSTSANVSSETFWKGVAAFWDEFPTYNEAKTYSYWFIANSSGTYTFTMYPFFATNKTVAEFEALTAPFFNNLTALGIPYNISTSYDDSFYPAYNGTFGTIDYHVGGVTSLPGNRILPKENWDNATIAAETLAVVKDMVDNSLRIGIYHQAPADVPVLNSANPAFRNAYGQLIAIELVNATATPAQLKAKGEFLTDTILGPLRDITPTGGTYYNEADIGEPNWQDAFWGDNYAKLLSAKQKWDPHMVFYNYHGVGSEDWYVDDGGLGVQTQNGKLCHV